MHHMQRGLSAIAQHLVLMEISTNFYGRVTLVIAEVDLSHF